MFIIKSLKAIPYPLWADISVVEASMVAYQADPLPSVLASLALGTGSSGSAPLPTQLPANGFRREQRMAQSPRPLHPCGIP